MRVCYSFLAVVAMFIIYFLPPVAAAERVFIDITAPYIEKLPIAIQDFSGGEEISDIVRNNLEFTGLFRCFADDAQIEKPGRPFNPANWRGFGIELVTKGRATMVDGRLSVTVSAYDVSTGRGVFKKEYSAPAGLLRPLSHAIANDIYRVLTGQQGIFRTKIAFVNEEGGNKELYLMDWDGHRMRGLGITGCILLTPRWSTDGDSLLYSALRNHHWGIYLFDKNIMSERNIVALRGLNMVGNFFPANRDFVFTSSKGGRPDIYIGNIVDMKTERLISSPWIDTSPSISPDGNKLLFVSTRSGLPQIYISGKDGHGINRLTFRGSHNTSPAWSPKGDKIAFVSRIAGKNQIFIMRPDGIGLIQLTERGNNEDPTFSPNGRQVAFVSDRSGTKGIYIMNINGEGERRISPEGFKAVSPSWSPL